MILPRLALSARQPWALALALGWKDIENRHWRAPNPGLKFRGEFAIHASRGMTSFEYLAAAECIKGLGYECPPPAELQRGGIVGVARIVEVVKTSDSPWFFGPVGLVIADARPVDFIPVSGALGFFEWKEDREAEAPPPARWMQPKPPAGEIVDDPQRRLL